jgi:hypothetical protein
MKDRQNNVYKFDPTIRGWVEYFQLMQPQLGASDIFCAGRLDRITAATSFAATVIGLGSPEEPLFSSTVVVLPADTLNSQSEANLIETFFSMVIEHLREYYANTDKVIDAVTTKKLLRRRISLKVVNNNESTDLVEFLKGLSPSTAVFIMGAELYLPDFETLAEIASQRRESKQEGRARFDEDYWAQTVYNLASQVTSLSKDKHLFTLLFVQQYGPLDSRNSDLLKSIDNCALATVEAPPSESDEARMILKHGDRWLALAREQQIDEVLREIDELPFSAINRAVVKAQCLMVAHRPLLSFKIIEPFLDQIKTGTPQTIFNAARIAKSAGQYSESVSLLQAGVRDHLTEPELNVALNLAVTLGENKVKSWASEELIRLYPRSPATIIYKFKKARAQDDFAILSNDIASLSGAIESNDEIYYIHLLADAFAATDAPDYTKLIAHVGSVLPSRKFHVVLECARHALRTGDFQQAANLCLFIEWPTEFYEDAAWHIVNALEQLLLRKRRVGEANGASDTRQYAKKIETLFSECLVFVLTYLGSWPNNGAIRAALYRVLSAETAGLEGLVYLTSAILDAPSARVSLPDHSDDQNISTREQLSQAEFEPLFEEILTKLPKPIIVGLGKLPSTRDSSLLNKFFNNIISDLQEVSLKTVCDDDDLWFIQVLLHIAILVSRELVRDSEYDLIGMAAAGVSASGHYQAARNLGEVALQLSSGQKSENRRAAWLCYSDIYLRGHNPLESLVGLGCALRCSDAVVSPTQRYHELVLTSRILRELNLTEVALKVLSSAREQALTTSHPSEAALRLDYMELALRFRELMHSRKGIGASNLPGLKQLADDIADLNRRNREQSKEIFPTALLLAQISGHLARSGESPDDKMREELDASLELIDSRRADLLRAFEGSSPTPDSVEALGSTLSSTRYSEDIGTDVAVITLLARRALDKVAGSDDAAKTLLLIEWLTDLSLNTSESSLFTRSDTVEVTEGTLRSYTDWMARAPDFTPREEELTQLHQLDNEADPSVRLSNRLPTSHEDLASFVREITRNDVAIHSIALAESGSLVRVSAGAGNLSQAIEPNDIFDYHAHKHWGKSYPHAYVNLAFDDLGALSTMEKSLSRIGISPKFADQPIVFVADVRLQNIPPNLFLVDGKIGGLDLPTAAAPSLTWLKAVRSSNFPSCMTRTAWIPASTAPDDTLLRLSSDLNNILTDYDFLISRDPLIPVNMSNSDVAIIGAHGGLQAENEWFRVVADEKSTRLTARDVAVKLRGSRIVVLFICSGGRLDPHPYSSSTVGLPQLLLDYGCRTVIASPWPIHVAVASEWLPEFLRALSDGDRAIVANFRANRTVAKRFNFNPAFCLAMNVFGDPFTQGMETLSAVAGTT